MVSYMCHFWKNTELCRAEKAEKISSEFVPIRSLSLDVLKVDCGGNEKGAFGISVGQDPVTLVHLPPLPTPCPENVMLKEVEGGCSWQGLFHKYNASRGNCLEMEQRS